jgi:hypothetical protein
MAAKNELTVAKGKEVVSLSVSGHKYVRVLDEKGNEVFCSDSPGESVSALLPAGKYTIESDGTVGKVDAAEIDKRHRDRVYDGEKPPTAPGVARK